MGELDTLLARLERVPENDFHLRELLKQVQTESGVIPFVGAGLSAPLGFATWSAFLSELGRRAGAQTQTADCLARGQFEEAAEDLRRRLGARSFDDLLETEYGEHRLDGVALRGAVRLIPAVAGRAVVTTNFDRVLERAFADVGERILTVFGHEAARKGAEALQRDQNVLLKLHGDCSTAAGRVLTLEEYRRSYGSKSAGEFDLSLPIPLLLSSMLATRSTLFLGCSLALDRTVRALLAVSTRLGTRSNYAVLAAPPAPDAFRERARQLADLGVRPIWYPDGQHDCVEAVLELLAKARAERPRASSPRPAPGVAPRKGNLPRSASTLIGRETELEQLASVLNAFRLVTIAGAPGVGKTRLSIELGRRVEASFPDGVWWIELDSLREGRLVPQRVANVLGVREQSHEPPQDSLRLHLRDQSVLLLIDNAEHVAASCAELVQFLVENCPGARIVATSRALLRAADEYVFELASLAAPAEDESDAGSLQRNESVALLLDRAAARGAPLHIDASNAPAIARLCRALDGVPLAIQLAAARLRSLSVHEVAERLSHGVDVLRSSVEGGRRQWETLTAALRWSYELLDAEQQQFLRRLAVFDGGWSLQAAQEIGCDGDAAPDAALELLETLHDQSLVARFERNGVSRFRLLEPIRQYALELLQSSGELAVLQSRHARWFVAYAESAEPHLTRSGSAEWLDRLTAEVDNLRAALRWLTGHGDGEAALRCAGALWRFFEIRGHFREGRERIGAALQVPGGGGFENVRGKALSGGGMLAYRQGDFDAARPLFAEALELARRRGDRAALASALNDMGILSQRSGDLDRAHQLLAEALELERLAVNPRGVGAALFNLGVTEFQRGQLDPAERRLRESCDAFRTADSERDRAFPLNWLALTALRRGDTNAAIGPAEESLALRTRTGDKRGIAETQRTLALIDVARREFGAARSRLLESMKLASGVGDQRGAAESLECIGLRAVAVGDSAHAVRVCGAAAALRQRARIVALPFEKGLVDAALAQAKTELGPERFERRWSEGLAWPATEFYALVTSDEAG